MHVPLSLCAESDLTSEYEWQAATNAENIIARYSAVIFFVLSIKLTLTCDFGAHVKVTYCIVFEALEFNDSRLLRRKRVDCRRKLAASLQHSPPRRA